MVSYGEREQVYPSEWRKVENELDIDESARRDRSRALPILKEEERTTNPSTAIILFIQTGGYRTTDDPLKGDIILWKEYNDERLSQGQSTEGTSVSGCVFSFKAEPDTRYVRLNASPRVIYPAALPIVDRLFDEGYVVLGPNYELFETDTPRAIDVRVPHV